VGKPQSRGSHSPIKPHRSGSSRQPAHGRQHPRQPHPSRGGQGTAEPTPGPTRLSMTLRGPPGALAGRGGRERKRPRRSASPRGSNPSEVLAHKTAPLPGWRRYSPLRREKERALTHLRTTSLVCPPRERSECWGDRPALWPAEGGASRRRARGSASPRGPNPSTRRISGRGVRVRRGWRRRSGPCPSSTGSRSPLWCPVAR
jgi:hypothetical protein